MKLTPKLLIAFTAIAILSISSLGFLSYKSARSALQEQAVKDLTLIGDAVEGHFYSFLDAVKSRAADFSSDGFIRNNIRLMQTMGASHPQYREIQKTLGTYMKQHKMSLDKAIKLMLVIGLNGRVIAATSEREIDFDEFRDAYFTEAKEGSYLSDVHFTHHTNGEEIIYIAASAPIRDLSTGALMGVIVNFYGSEELDKILSGEFQVERGAPTGMNSRGKPLDMYLVNREKQLITASIYSSGILRQRVETLPVTECASGREASGLYRNFTGLEVIGSSMCMPSKGWTLITEIEKTQALSSVYLLRGHIIELGLVILLLSLVLAYLIANRMTRPLRALSGITSKIADGDFCIYAEAASKDEIGELARSLNLMLTKLEESRNTMLIEKSRLEALVNGMADSVIFVDAKDKSVIINTAAQRLLGIRSEEASDYRLLSSRHIVAEELSDLQGLFDKGNFEFYSTEITYNLRDLELTVYPVRKDNTVVGTVSLIRDITERKIAEIELKERHNELEAAHEKLKAAHTQILQQDKMASIGQLAAGVAHEINNPIGYIKSNLGALQKYISKITGFVKAQAEAVEELAAQQAPATGQDAILKRLEEQRQALKLDYIIEDSASLITESMDGAERVKRIVQDLKSFSRIDETEYKMANLNEGLESTINIVWNELKYKVTLKKEFGDIPLTKCNLGQLNQVFMNLLVNAAHAIEKQGDITIKTWQDNGDIHVTISDTGSGIPEDKINRIFEPFFTTKEVGKGTGLGLSIAYDIIKKHNGDISVESRVGEGTTFKIKIPVVKG